MTRPLSELAQAGKLGQLGMDERARLLGGSLQIHSLPGKGTMVTVELPVNGPRLTNSAFAHLRQSPGAAANQPISQDLAPTPGA